MVVLFRRRERRRRRVRIGRSSGMRWYAFRVFLCVFGLLLFAEHEVISCLVRILTNLSSSVLLFRSSTLFRFCINFVIVIKNIFVICFSLSSLFLRGQRVDFWSSNLYDWRIGRGFVARVFAVIPFPLTYFRSLSFNTFVPVL